MNDDLKKAVDRYTEAMMARIEKSHIKTEVELAERIARQQEQHAWQELQALRDEALEPRVV